MEENKKTTVRLWTIISIIIIILLCVALGVTYYYGFVKDKGTVANPEISKNAEKIEPPAKTEVPEKQDNTEKSTKPEITENTKTVKSKSGKVKYSIRDYEGIPEVISLTINGNEVKHQLPDTLFIEETEDVYIDEQKDFVILNIDEFSTALPIWELYIFDYSGNLLFEIDEIRINDGMQIRKEYLEYAGEYSYDKDEKTITYVKELRYDETGGEFYIPELSDDIISFEELSKIDKEKIEKIDAKVIYEIKYLGNGEFTSPKVISSTKLTLDKAYKMVYGE